MIPRSEMKEILDSDAVDPKDVIEAYQTLAKQNQWFLYNWMLLHYLKPFIKPSQPLSIIDVGAGTGDFSLYLARFAKKHGLNISITALEPNPILARHLESEVGNLPIQVEQKYLHELPGQFDVVVVSQVLHHIGPDQLVEFLRQLRSHARRAVVISDFNRSTLASKIAFFAIAMLSDNQISRHDGPLSVLRSHTQAELLPAIKQAGFADFTFHNLFFPRKFMVLRK